MFLDDFFHEYDDHEFFMTKAIKGNFSALFLKIDIDAHAFCTLAP